MDTLSPSGVDATRISQVTSRPSTLLARIHPGADDIIGDCIAAVELQVGRRSVVRRDVLVRDRVQVELARLDGDPRGDIGEVDAPPAREREVG